MENFKQSSERMSIIKEAINKLTKADFEEVFAMTFDSPDEEELNFKICAKVEDAFYKFEEVVIEDKCLKNEYKFDLKGAA